MLRRLPPSPQGAWVEVEFGPRATGRARSRKARGSEEQESPRWLKGLRRTAEVQGLCPPIRLVKIADREADLYELFQAAVANPRRHLPTDQAGAVAASVPESSHWAGVAADP